VLLQYIFAHDVSLVLLFLLYACGQEEGKVLLKLFLQDGLNCLWQFDFLCRSTNCPANKKVFCKDGVLQ